MPHYKGFQNRGFKKFKELFYEILLKYSSGQMPPLTFPFSVFVLIRCDSDGVKGILMQKNSTRTGLTNRIQSAGVITVETV